jgi:hypothetical protein
MELSSCRLVCCGIIAAFGAELPEQPDPGTAASPENGMAIKILGL